MFPIIIDGTACNSRQRLDRVNQTHLVLASVKLVLQKMKEGWSNHHFVWGMEPPTLKQTSLKDDLSDEMTIDRDILK